MRWLKCQEAQEVPINEGIGDMITGEVYRLYQFAYCGRWRWHRGLHEWVRWWQEGG